MQKNLLNYASPKIRDIEKYAQITDTNLDKRIAICINGEMVSIPVIKMKISDWACSALLSKEQITSMRARCVANQATFTIAFLRNIG